MSRAPAEKAGSPFQVLANPAEQRVMLPIVPHPIETADPRMPGCDFLNEAPVPPVAHAGDQYPLAGIAPRFERLT